MHSRTIKHCLLGAALLALAACGGGGGGGTSPAVPAAQPTAPPGNSSSSSVSLSLSSLSFGATGASAAQTILVSEKNYTGTFSVSGCSGIAQTADLGANKYQITPLQAGICALTFSDSSGHSAALGITVTTTQITIQP